MNNFLKDRKSVRDFKNKKVKKDILEEIQSYCEEFEEEESKIGFEFPMFEDGKRIFESLSGVGGYAGVMIESPHYIGLKLLDGNEDSEIYGAYYMEKLITKLTELNLGSCWISLAGVEPKIKEILFDLKDERMDYILAIGHPARKNPFKTESTSSRLGVDDIVFDGKIGNSMDQDELEHRGLDDLFYYIRFAPSGYNSQPWRFILKQNKVSLLLSYITEDELSLTDAGIIMYYFENLAKSLGIENSWKLVNKSDIADGNCRYRYIGEFNL